MQFSNVEYPATGTTVDRVNLERATEWLAEILSPFFRDCRATWSLTQHRHRGPQYTLHLVTPWGEGEANFTPEELASSYEARLVLYRLTNSILKEYSHRMLEARVKEPVS